MFIFFNQKTAYDMRISDCSSDVCSSDLVKALTEGKHRSGGRNNMGHATARGIGGGHKQRYRIADFKRRKWDVPATVERLEYDPKRSAFLVLVQYEDGEVAYLLDRLRVPAGDQTDEGTNVVLEPGDAVDVWKASTSTTPQ